MASKKKVQLKTEAEARSSKLETRNAKLPTSNFQLQASNFKLWTQIAVMAITLIVMFPVLRNDFINFDDPQYVTSNPVIEKLNSESVKQFFTQQFVGNYQPVVMLSYAAQFRFFGLHAGGYHFISLLFHLLNTALVFVIVFRLLRNNTAAVITALLFGIHPLHVESIAWVSSQKDVLYTFFFLGAIYFYLNGRWKMEDGRWKHPASKFYLLTSSFFFILSVLCKAQAVVLPVVLLLIDFWQNKKLTWKMVMQKTPYFIIAVLFGFLAVMMQKKAGAVQDYAYFAVWQRILFSSFGFVNYLWQTLLPIKLSIFYPYPETHDKINSVWVYAAPLIIIAFGALAFWLRKRSPITVFGVLFFCINIFLVIQLIPVGDAIHADRYTYISLIGFFIIGGYYFGKRFDAQPNKRTLLLIGSALYFIVISALTLNQARQWKDSISIYTASLANYPAPIVYCNRGAEYFRIEKYQAAFNDFNSAVTMRPRFPNAFKDRGLAYEKLQDYQKAIDDFTSAMTYNSKDVTLYFFRANDCKQLNRYDAALKDYNTVLTMDSSNTDAYYSRAEVYGRSGKLAEALTDYNTVISKRPESDGAYSNRGIVYSLMGNYSAAILDFTKAIELNPKFWNSYYNRSLAYQHIGEIKKAYDDAMIAKKNDYPVEQVYLDQLVAEIK